MKIKKRISEKGLINIFINILVKKIPQIIDIENYPGEYPF